MTKRSTSEEIFVRFVIDDEGRTCKDIPESSCHEEPRNFLTHIGSLSLSKSADGLIDPKLVLSWLVTTLGGSPAAVGLLVPIREAGALLPQLFTAAAIRKLPLRKYAWAIGSLLQGVAAIGIGLAAIFSTKETSSWLILALLAVLAVSRSVCSVSYKDVLGKTISKSRRGTATGLASSLSSTVVIAFAVILAFDLFPRLSVVLTGVFIAGGLWLLAGCLFLTLDEEKGAVDGGRSSIKLAVQNFSLLKSDTQLRRFIAVRALLTATALAPPFMISNSAANDLNSFGGLGVLVIASALSVLLSSFVWGRSADSSSRKVLLVAASISCLALAVTAWSLHSGALNQGLLLPALLFVLMVAHQGVRLGRSTHLVDMAAPETRAAYTALSNTAIGLILLAGGLFSLVAAKFGVVVVLACMATMCALAIFCALSLDEVQ